MLRCFFLFGWRKISLCLLVGAVFSSLSVFAEVSERATAIQKSKVETIKFNPKKPIQINADQLDIDQNIGKAVFRGQVDVVHDGMSLRCDQLIIEYIKPEEDTSRSPKKNSNMQQLTAQSVRTLNAKGHVFLSFRDQVAQAQSAVYNLKSRKVILRGNVMLSKGRNVIQGQVAYIDLDTGQSSLSGKGVGQSNGNNKQRVRTLLYFPEE